MTKILHKENFINGFKSVSQKLETLERSWALLSILPEVDTTGKSNSEIDSAVVGGNGNPPNGKMISDSINNLLLIRQKGAWRKIKLE
jgi:hypothetical protein